MIVLVIIAGLLAFAASVAFGRMLVPVLDRKKETQPVRDRAARKTGEEQAEGAEKAD